MLCARQWTKQPMDPQQQRGNVLLFLAPTPSWLTNLSTDTKRRRESMCSPTPADGSTQTHFLFWTWGSQQGLFHLLSAVTFHLRPHYCHCRWCLPPRITESMSLAWKGTKTVKFKFIHHRSTQTHTHWQELGWVLQCLIATSASAVCSIKLYISIN